MRVTSLQNVQCPIRVSGLMPWVIVCAAMLSGPALEAAELRIGRTTVAAGETADATITYHSEGALVSGLQCDLAFGRDLVIAAVTTGSAGTLAGKVIQSAPQPDGRLRLMLVGFNQTVIPDGPVIGLKVKVNPGTRPGRRALRCENVSAARFDGQDVPLDAFPGQVLVRPSK